MSALCQYRTVWSYKDNVRKAAIMEQNEIYLWLSALAFITGLAVVSTVEVGSKPYKRNTGIGKGSCLQLCSI